MQKKYFASHLHAFERYSILPSDSRRFPFFPRTFVLDIKGCFYIRLNAQTYANSHTRHIRNPVRRWKILWGFELNYHVEITRVASKKNVLFKRAQAGGRTRLRNCFVAKSLHGFIVKRDLCSNDASKRCTFRICNLNFSQLSRFLC